MKIIIAAAFLCTCSLFSMHRQLSQEEIERIWYVQQMKHLREWADHQETLTAEQYHFYTQQRKPATKVIRKDGIVQR
jgi:hypothetical protein